MDEDWLEAIVGEAQEAQEAPAEEGVGLEALVDDFVGFYKNMRQRDAGWYASMGVTVGGSELAAVMGMNPYSTFYDVVLSKIATLGGGSSWDGGSEACWWGVLFEDVIAAYVATDLGGTVKGDEICIREFAGHRNSPDGFIVANFYRGADGALHLWTTDKSPDIPTLQKILLLEFKCPISRKPAMAVPKHYMPQLWSGLMVAPVAHQGLFVDAVFRKCGLLDLGDTSDYDTDYHPRDRSPAGGALWELPVAWGLVGVYAPLLDAPRHVRYGWRGPEWAPGDPSADEPDADASQAAWQVHSAYFGLRLRNQAATRDAADLGDMEARAFNRVLGLINRGRFPVVRVAPCFADGRGHDLHSGRAIGGTIEALRRQAPPHHWLLGVLPWKLFEVDYVPVDRRPGFADEALPLIEEVHQTVTEAVASGDPIAYLASKASRFARAAPPAGKSAVVSDADVQDLFDAIGGAPSK